MKIKLLTIVYMLAIWGSYAHGESPEQRKPAQILSNSVYKDIAKVQQAMQVENYDEALLQLKALQKRFEKLKPYDKAKTYEMLANVYLAKTDYASASKAAEQAIAMQALGDDAQLYLHHRLFYLYFFSEQYPQAIEHVEIWLATVTEPDVASYFAAAQVYALSQRLERGLALALQGFDLLNTKPNVEIKQNWYQLLVSIQLKLQDYQGAAISLQDALSLWPSQATYYQQLSAVYQQLKREKEAFAVLSLAYQNELLQQESELSRLLQLYRYHDYAYKGAQLFDAAMQLNNIKNNEQNWQHLSNAWLQSRQWSSAESALLQAAQLSGKPEHWLRLCQTAFQDERWQQTLGYCNKALHRGGLQDEDGAAWYLIALAEYYQDQLQRADEAFEQCARWQDTKKDCLRWRQFVVQTQITQQQEQQRQQDEAKELERRRNAQQDDIDKAIIMAS